MKICLIINSLIGCSLYSCYLKIYRLIWAYDVLELHKGPFHAIMKTYLYNFDPLKLHFYIVKLGFTGVYIIFLISAQNIDCGYLLELPR